jgi:hypothetical protein
MTLPDVVFGTCLLVWFAAFTYWIVAQRVLRFGAALFALGFLFLFLTEWPLVEVGLAAFWLIAWSVTARYRPEVSEVRMAAGLVSLAALVSLATTSSLVILDWRAGLSAILLFLGSVATFAMLLWCLHGTDSQIATIRSVPLIVSFGAAAGCSMASILFAIGYGPFLPSTSGHNSVGILVAVGSLEQWFLIVGALQAGAAALLYSYWLAMAALPKRTVIAH